MDTICQEKIRSYQRIGNLLIASTATDKIIILAEFHDSSERPIQKKTIRKRMKKSDLPILSEPLISLPPRVITGAASTIRKYLETGTSQVEETPKDAA